MPPPTRANNAIDEAPIPKVSIVDVIVAASSLKPSFRIKYQMEISSNPRPTTEKPITEPAENAMLSPLLRLLRHAFAVLAFALVAMYIPM